VNFNREKRGAFIIEMQKKKKMLYNTNLKYVFASYSMSVWAYFYIVISPRTKKTSAS